MGYSIDPISANCYPGTTILINKFDIRDEEKLNEIESVISSGDRRKFCVIDVPRQYENHRLSQE